jgi:long-subunit acyl-CoA synthetase (AMP-forming)
MPKGVVLTQETQAAAINAQLCGSTLTDGAMLSYLPLAHIYAVRREMTGHVSDLVLIESPQRLCELSVIAIGGSLGSFTGDPLRLLEDAQILKPVFFPSVPRVLNRIYQSAMVAGNVPGVRGALFKRAVETKLQRLRSTGDATHAFWDRLVFRKACLCTRDVGCDVLTPCAIDPGGAGRTDPDALVGLRADHEGGRRVPAHRIRVPGHRRLRCARAVTPSGR